MAKATVLVSNARSLQGELKRCTQRLEAVRESILARREPDVVRMRFRECQTTMLSVGRFLMLDRRFRPRLASDKREAALAMLRAGKRPIDLRRELGIDNNTARRMR